MAHLSHDFPQRLVNVITNAVSIFLLIVIFYIVQYIFDMDFVCSCRPGVHLNGILYLTVPPLILTWVVNITEPLHQRRIFSSWQSLCPNNFCSIFLKLFINYLTLSFVWVATVLFDGDWYICLMTNLNDSQTGIPCKTNLSYEEYRIKADYKTASLDIGFGVICVLFIFWSTVESIKAYHIRKKTWKRGCKILCPPYYRVVYEGILDEQVSNHLRDELTKIASERAKAICKPFLRVIEENEHPFTCDGNESTVSEAWEKNSAPDFLLMDHEKTPLLEQRR